MKNNEQRQRVEQLMADTMETIVKKYKAKADADELAPSELAALVRLFKDNNINVAVEQGGMPDFLKQGPTEDDLDDGSPSALPFPRAANN